MSAQPQPAASKSKAAYRDGFQAGFRGLPRQVPAAHDQRPAVWGLAYDDGARADRGASVEVQSMRGWNSLKNMIGRALSQRWDVA